MRDCGCRVIPETDGEIIYCPVHAAAPAMYEALIFICGHWNDEELRAEIWQRIRDAIPQAEGVQP